MIIYTKLPTASLTTNCNRLRNKITHLMTSTMLAEFVGIIFTDITVSFYLSYSTTKERKQNP